MASAKTRTEIFYRVTLTGARWGACKARRTAQCPCSCGADCEHTCTGTEGEGCGAQSRSGSRATAARTGTTRRTWPKRKKEKKRMPTFGHIAHMMVLRTRGEKKKKRNKRGLDQRHQRAHPSRVPRFSGRFRTPTDTLVNRQRSPLKVQGPLQLFRHTNPNTTTGKRRQSKAARILQASVPARSGSTPLQHPIRRAACRWRRRA